MTFRAILAIDQNNGQVVRLNDIHDDVPPHGTPVCVETFPRLRPIPLTETEWHALSDDVFRAAWESMPRVALFDGNQAVDSDDRAELLGSIRLIANGFLVRTRDGTDRALTERYFATRQEAEEHLRKVLAADCYRMISEAP